MRKYLLILLLFLAGCADAQLFNYLRQRTLSSTDGTQVIYSVVKVNQAYTGACIRLRDETADTETDIGFLNGILDYTAADTYLAGHVGRVATIYDQDGDPQNATQTTEANMPYYKTASYAPNGLPSIFWNRRSGDQDHYFNISLNTDSNDLAWCGVAQGYIAFFPGTASTDVLFYFGGAPSVFVMSDNVVFRSSTKNMLLNSSDAAPFKLVSLTQIGVKMRSGVEASYFYDNIQSQTFSALTTQRVNTTALLGKRSNTTNKQLGMFQELIVYTSSMSAPVETIMKSDQRHCFKILNKRYLVPWCGHSKEFGYITATAFNTPIEVSPAWYAQRLAGEEYSFMSFGVPSATIQTFLASTNYTTVVAMLNTTDLVPIFAYLDAGNNIGTDDTPTLISRFDSFIAGIKAAAPNTRFLFTTITSRSTYAATPAYEQTRLDFNAHLLANYNNPSLNYWTVDLSQSPNIGQANSYLNSYHDPDGIHFSALGNEEVAAYLVPVLQRIR